MLHKALNKFPAGTGKRWEVVQGYVRTRTVEEILDMVKHGLKAGGWLPHVGAACGCCRVWVLAWVPGTESRRMLACGCWCPDLKVEGRWRMQ